MVLKPLKDDILTRSYTVWAATTTDQDYIKAEGLKRTIANPAHRKELVAGGIAPYLLSRTCSVSSPNIRTTC